MENKNKSALETLLKVGLSIVGVIIFVVIFLNLYEFAITPDPDVVQCQSQCSMHNQTFHERKIGYGASFAGCYCKDNNGMIERIY